ncbi:hypothetical protein [Citrobacter cronae]|uniref:Uncharacterized protein n=1 Tax=Citrobacter cronae TaxID=1748967 RepID=A0A7X1BSX9_9ENTR|nr:hypothetical protein [Citrobacter cronae]EBD5844828.1 hypothetical protein [Salmonella enterica]EDD5452158.1 hypothetical protein [Salmonella enterica subsp. enterica serovar Paratyphi B]EBD6593544.1 hypothetical protein [Salmonella enterica]EDE4810715.1 hypothetical protein [Salmonella enterica subsp. enterica serovar Paratyphi B]MBC2622042.1 hypothetical protein [Citrobacter cronae]
MAKKNIHQEEIVFAKKQLVLLSTLKGKVSDLTQKWEGNIGAEAPDYHLLMKQLEAVEKQIFSRIGAWKKTSFL